MCSLLLPCNVIKRTVTSDRTASGKAGSKAMQVWRLCLIREWVPRIQGSILNKHEGITMENVHTTFCDDVNGSTRASTRFCRQTIVDDLKLLYGFRRQFGTRRAGELVVILHAIDIQAVAS